MSTSKIICNLKNKFIKKVETLANLAEIIRIHLYFCIFVVLSTLITPNAISVINYTKKYTQIDRLGKMYKKKYFY